jgi:DNA mismatch repair protein MutS
LGGLSPHHALLTGPNKGGKSTVLRAVALSALLAHTYGCAVGNLTATPFHALYVCLKPDDLPGMKSRFEREIEFTAQTLRPHSGPILVLLDELYHSTNPPDALSSCIHYSDKLWKSPSILSIISTHLFQWVEESPPSVVQRLCCPAKYDKEGVLQFLYELHPGICRVSSVELLLQQNGMVLSSPPSPVSPASCV